MANVATNTSPVSNITVKGVVVCILASSFAASLQLTNNYVAPVSNIAGTGKPWVQTDK